ncbi:MAG TPA: hypothetical protein VM884_08565 [Flavisolibacter sp.]|nr:hypothetical protein [Flavisolibacter sp.]
MKNYLEELMDLKRTVSIKFRFAGGGITETKGRIVKLDFNGGTVQTDCGWVIGINQILAINARSFENIC